MDSSSFKNLSVLSWNTQGLGQDGKCVLVRDAVVAANPSIACLQETKLKLTDNRNLRSWLEEQDGRMHRVP
jgi:exonuclease III